MLTFVFSGNLKRPLMMVVMYLFQVIWIIPSFIHSFNIMFIKGYCGPGAGAAEGVKHESPLPGVSSLVGRTVEQTNNYNTGY